jgi:tRNA A-37 threonylcarbamoyl transferase component Bud32
MATASTASLVDALGRCRLLEAAQLEEVVGDLQARLPDPQGLAEELVRRGWLTSYQATLLLQGRGPELVLGQYVLLERLGEGGMGQVFKARHRNLGRVVALKLIRKERLDNPDAVRRFQREVRAAAALSHPNIVLAYDADQIGGTHLLVMEYVEGSTDLARLVRKHGPLPVCRACEYARQAALGLQHAHERGLVHRDVKPHNLLLTADGHVVKVLDMGLARLDHPPGDDWSSTMTQEGVVMGTPDYLAPEQALASHTVDVRADLYSLGCTLYFLLTGKVPFPGGTLAEKLLKHQLQEPRPLAQLRPDVPPGVAAVVRKLMAKRPGDRYQTPAEVAAALSSVSGTGGGPPQAPDTAGRAPAEGIRAGAGTSGDSFDAALDYMARRGDTQEADSPERRRREAEQRRLLLLSAAGVGVLLVGVAVLMFLVWKGTGAPRTAANEANLPAGGPEVGRQADPATAGGQGDRLPGRFEGHVDAVTSVAVSADGRNALSGGFDRSLRLWDLAAGKEVRRFFGHTDVVWAVALSGDGRRALSGSQDRTVRLWDTRSGNEVQRFEGHTGVVSSVSFLPGGSRVMSGNWDHTVRVWDTQGGKEVRRFAVGAPVLAFALSADARQALLASTDGFLRLWDLEAGKEVRRFPGPRGPVESVALSPDGRRVVTASGDRAADPDSAARLYDLESGQEVRRFRGHADKVDCVAFSPNGRRILSCGQDRTVRLWDAEGGQEVHCFFGHAEKVRSLAFLPTGLRAVSGSYDRTLRLWDLAGIP